MTPNTVDCMAPVRLTVTSPIQHLCPYRNERDIGSVTVTFDVDGSTFELHSLRAYFDSWRDSTVSHENLTDRIAIDLAPECIRVHSIVTRWETAGMEVECSTSPIPAGQPW